jgi:hypothetical protein
MKKAVGNSLPFSSFLKALFSAYFLVSGCFFAKLEEDLFIYTGHDQALLFQYALFDKSRSGTGFANPKQYKPASRLHLTPVTLLLLYYCFTSPLLLVY